MYLVVRREGEGAGWDPRGLTPPREGSGEVVLSAVLSDGDRERLKHALSQEIFRDTGFTEKTT